MSRFAVSLAWLGITAAVVQAASPIPLELPRPDGQPGNPKKPVKVYILAGQSNMVGMGDLTGARPEFPTIFYSADPAIIPSATPVGANERGQPFAWIAAERHGVYDAQAAVSAGTDTAAGPVSTTPVALGTATINLPAIKGSQRLVVTAEIDVPVTGTYLVRAGFEDSAFNVVTLDGKEVSRRDEAAKPVLTKVVLEQGKRYPIKIMYAKSGSAAFWVERVDMVGQGDLVTLTTKDKKFPYLIDDAGNWTVRQDVYFQEARLVEGGKGAPMSAESNKKCLPKCNAIGPEVGFGYVLGTFLDEQVLLIKTAQGNRSLKFDFRPPSSGRTEPTNEYEGYEYRAMVQGVRETLEKIDTIVPGYQGQGYEIAGFGWFQGHKDSGATKEEYETNLVNLIQDLRKEFNAPAMKAVVATVGFEGYRIVNGPWYGIWQAQMAVGDPKQHPEFVGNVASVDTRDFWREVNESPRSQGYHYHRNAETYMLVGEAMGRAMVRLHGGEAVALPKSDREAKVLAEIAAEAARPEPTDEQQAAHRAAIRPMILESALESFVDDTKNQAAIKAAFAGQKPAKASPFLADVVDDAVEFYQAAGVKDYDWHPFGADLRTTAWEYHGFDLPGRPSTFNVSGGEGSAPATTAAAKPPEVVPVQLVFPAGLEKWFATDFDAAKAGWKTAVGPFGESAEKVTLPEWAQARIAKRVPQTLIDNDVLLLRQSVEIPQFKEGHRYRIRLAGSAHNNMGEGYAIYANGKLLAENNEGVLAWRQQGATPRGVLVFPEFREILQDGRVTLAVSNFPMGNWSAGRFVPPGLPLAIWIEEQKLPPIAE